MQTRFAVMYGAKEHRYQNALSAPDQVWRLRHWLLKHVTSGSVTAQMPFDNKPYSASDMFITNAAAKPQKNRGMFYKNRFSHLILTTTNSRRQWTMIPFLTLPYLRSGLATLPSVGAIP